MAYLGLSFCWGLGLAVLPVFAIWISARQEVTDTDKYTLRCFLLRLGFIGEEFATARDLLTRRLAGDAAFRNGRAA